MESSPTTTRRHLLILGAIILLGLGLRSWHLANHLASPLGHVEDVFTSSDMHAFSVWAEKIADGDWLCRDSYHPYMDWMEPIAPLEKFEEWWGGKEIYHQTPLYAYLLAVSFLAFDSNVPLLILQVLCSSAALLLVFDLGRRMFDAQAGLIAAGIAALFAPAIVLDAIQLRGSLNASLTLLSIWLLLRLRDSGSIRLGIATGVCLACSYFLRPTGLVLLILGPAVLLADKVTRPGWKRWGIGLLGGAILTIVPFAVRNLVVGAPVLTFSTRGPETVIQANSAGAEPGFMSVMGTEAYRSQMEAGHGSVLRALGTAIDSWPDDSELGWWLWHQWQKLLCVFGDYEYANNISFYFYSGATPLLHFLPTFGWFVGLALVGVLLLGFCGRQRVTLWIPLIAAGALVMGCLLGFAMGRYRMPLGVLLAIPAGVTVSLLIGWVRAKSSLRIALTAVSAIVISWASFAVVPSKTHVDASGGISVDPDSVRAYHLVMTRQRAQEYLMASRVLHDSGRTAEAVRLLDSYRQRVLDLMDAKGPEYRRTQDGHAMWFMLYSSERTMRQLAQYFRVMGDARRAGETNQLANRMQQDAKALRGG